MAILEYIFPFLLIISFIWCLFSGFFAGKPKKGTIEWITRTVNTPEREWLPRRLSAADWLIALAITVVCDFAGSYFLHKGFGLTAGSVYLLFSLYSEKKLFGILSSILCISAFPFSQSSVWFELLALSLVFFLLAFKKPFYFLLSGVLIGCSAFLQWQASGFALLEIILILIYSLRNKNVKSVFPGILSLLLGAAAFCCLSYYLKGAFPPVSFSIMFGYFAGPFVFCLIATILYALLQGIREHKFYFSWLFLISIFSLFLSLTGKTDFPLICFITGSVIAGTVLSDVFSRGTKWEKAGGITFLAVSLCCILIKAADYFSLHEIFSRLTYHLSTTVISDYHPVLFLPVTIFINL